MDVNYKGRVLFYLIVWIYESQVVHPKIINNREVVWLSYENCNRQVLYNYAFDYFRDNI